jgi:protoheme IX farnesyltransferase
MSGKPFLVPAIDVRPTAGRRFLASSQVSDYWALTKPEVNFLILIATSAGFYLASVSAGRQFSVLALFNTLLGTLLVASGTATLNQYVERKFDAQMRRTARRPLAAGRLDPQAVLAFGIVLSVVGCIYLAATTSLLASALTLFTLLSYLFLYTPLKRRTPLCVLVGAIPGAMPPLIGWAAVSGTLKPEAWLLFAVLFLWQFPHFMAIAWMYREDYDRAGYFMLPKGRARVALVILQTVLPLLALIPLSTRESPSASAIFYWLAPVLGLAFLYFGLDFVLEQSRGSARRLLAASIIYLPLLFALRVTLA